MIRLESMNPHSGWRPLGLALVSVAVFAAPAASAPTLLPDSTTIESWQLGNGLKVVTKNIPRCRGVAMTLAFPTGTDADPPARRGLAQLMAEVEMMAPAGDVPERTREEMASLRPLGWSLKVGRRATQLSEVATVAQFPGALRQLAMRLQGVSVSDAVLKSGLASVRRDQNENLLGTVDNALYFQVGEIAGGVEPAAIPELAAARELTGVSAKELEQRLRATFVPAGAVLALAGDLGGVNVHAMVEGQFARMAGRSPGGAPPGDPPRRAFKPSWRAIPRPDVDNPVGILAVNAPALADSAHPRFFLSMLLMAEHCYQFWGQSPLLKTRFRYSILDEPELVRFYPALQRDSTGARAPANELRRAMAELVGQSVGQDEYEKLRFSLLWVLGGPMMPPLLAQVRGSGPALNNVCSGLAARELTGGEAFWSAYRRRFLVLEDPGLDAWARYVCAPEHQAGIVFTPSGKSGSAAR